MSKTEYKIVCEIDLEPRRRPVVQLPLGTALIDTGATLPMFYFTPEVLSYVYNKVDMVRDNVSIGGIGDGAVIGKIFSIEGFSLGSIKYQDFQVFVPDRLYKVDASGKKRNPMHTMILSATMFEGFLYEFDSIHRTFRVMSPPEIEPIVDFKISTDKNGNLFPIVNGVYSID